MKSDDKDEIIDALRLIFSDYSTDELLKLIDDKRKELGPHVIDNRTASFIVLRGLQIDDFIDQILKDQEGILHKLRMGPTILPSNLDSKSLKKLIESSFEKARLSLVDATETHYDEVFGEEIPLIFPSEELPSVTELTYDLSHQLCIQDSLGPVIQNWIEGNAVWVEESKEKTLNIFVNELASFYPRHEPTPNLWTAGIGLLHGVVMDSNPIDIGTSLRIRKLNQLEHSIIMNSKSESLGWYHKAIKYNLENKHREPMCIVECVSIGEEHFPLKKNASSFTPLKREVIQKMQDILICLNLISRKVVSAERVSFPTIRVALRPEFHPPIRSMGIMGPLSISTQNQSPLNLSQMREEFLSVYQALTEFRNFQKTKFHDDFERAVTRFLQSTREYYLEDVVVDLALSIETITKLGIRPLGDKIASFLAMDDESEEIQRIHDQFSDLRNSIIHGSVFKVEDVHKIVKKMTQIVQALLRNALFYSVTNGIPPTKKGGFQGLLKACLVNMKRREEVQDTFPIWSVRNLSKSLGVGLDRIS